MIGCFFKVSGNDLKFEKKSKQKKNDSPVSGTPGSHFCWCPVYWEVLTPGVPDTGEFWLPVSRIPGSFDSWCPGYWGVLTPGVPDTGKLGLPGVPDTRGVANPRCPGHRESFFWLFTVFFKLQVIFLHPLKQQSIKKQCGSYIYYTRPFGWCFQNFPNFIISLMTPGVPYTGESF